MKRILILCAALALLAAAGVSSLQEAEDPGALLALVNPQDTSVIVRRVHEGPDLDFWGTCPSPDGRYVTQTDWDTGDLAVLDLLTGQKRRVSGKGDDGWANSFAYSEAACFSPDGQRIAYSWYTEPGLYELRIINADGTNSHLVARPGFDPTDPPPSYIDFPGRSPTGVWGRRGRLRKTGLRWESGESCQRPVEGSSRRMDRGREPPLFQRP